MNTYLLHINRFHTSLISTCFVFFALIVNLIFGTMGTPLNESYTVKGSIMCIINVNCVRLLDRIYLSYCEWKKWKIRGCTTLLIHRVCHDNNNNIPSPHPLFSKKKTTTTTTSSSTSTTTTTPTTLNHQQPATKTYETKQKIHNNNNS